LTSDRILFSSSESRPSGTKAEKKHPKIKGYENPILNAVLENKEEAVHKRFRCLFLNVNFLFLAWIFQ
jgi:hypothetical protein